MTRSKLIGFGLAGALLATTGFMLPSDGHADTGYRSGTNVAVGYRDHRDYQGHRGYRDHRGYDDRKRGHYEQHRHQHPPRHRHYVQRYYHAPHDYRPYYAPRYYGHGHSGWDIDLHYRFNGR